MKNIKIKISRDFRLIIGLVLVLLPLNSANANLNEKFRENFGKIVREKYYNTINYSVDDSTGWELKEQDGKSVWTCTGGKCAEFQKKINCLFDDAFENAVNQTNQEVLDYVKGVEISELKQKAQIKDPDCEKITLQNIQDEQGINDFKSSCKGQFISSTYSTCRVAETILNELGAYQNYLLAKSEDNISFSREFFEDNEYKRNKLINDSTEAKKQYLKDIEQSQQAVLDTLTLYKDFIHRYRIHAWLLAIKHKLKKIHTEWFKVQKATETYPIKFPKANSIGG